MNPAERERLRLCLLQQLALSADAGRALASLVQGAHLADFTDASEDVVRGELVYLLDKGLVIRMAKLISPENARWRITAAGRDVLAEAGL
jgi:hypothetical protein